MRWQTRLTIVVLVLCGLQVAFMLMLITASRLLDNGNVLVFVAATAESGYGNNDIVIADVERGLLHTLIHEPGPEIDPVWSPNGESLAYISVVEGIREVFVIETLTGTPRALSNSDAFESLPSWSPNGAWVSYESGQDGNSEIYVAQPSGGSPHNISQHPGTDFPGRWSPDGSQMAYVSLRDGMLRALVVAVDNPQPEQLGDFQTTFRPPAWSPDGTRLALEAQRVQAGQITDLAVLLVNADGSAMQRLVPDTPLSRAPEWSPDGSLIALEVQQSEDESAVVVVDVASGGQHTITQMPGQEHEPLWSPDGTRLLFFKITNNGIRRTLYVSDADGDNLVEIGSQPSNFDRSGWSPDGRYVAYTDVLPGRSTVPLGNTILKVVDTRTGETHTLVPDAAHYMMPRWRP